LRNASHRAASRQDVACAGRRPREPHVAPRGSDQGDPSWKASGGEAAGDSDCRKIQKIGEIGVNAKIAVSCDWVFRYLGKRIRGTCGGYQQKIDAPPNWIYHFGKHLEPMLGTENFNAAHSYAPLDNGTCYRAQRFRLLFQKGLRRKTALRRPGLVEKRANFCEWCEIDFVGDTSERNRAADRLLEQPRDLLVAKKLELMAMRDPEAKRIWSSRRPNGET
jgi:hypothetical protein